MNPDQLKYTALEIRKSVLKSLEAAASGHLGGSLGLADVFTALYFQVMDHKPDNPSWEDRDKLVLSIGHVAPVLYASLAEAGYFPKSELLSLRKLGSRLQGHPGRDHGLPGLELSAGSLGQGLCVAVGMAMAHQMDKKTSRIFCVLGDGELQEGSVWEAAMAASHYKMKHLCAIVDRNNLQIDGSTEDVMKLEPLKHKWESFGWEVKVVDGHNIQAIIKALEVETKNENPKLILAKTLMGKGIKSIENDYKWHAGVPDRQQLEVFLKELESCH